MSETFHAKRDPKISFSVIIRSFQGFIITFEEILALLNFSKREIRKIQLSHALIDRDGCRIGKIKAPAIGMHWYPETVIEMSLEDVIRDTRALFSEDKIDLAVLGNSRKINGRMRLLAVSRHKEIGARILGFELGEALVIIVLRPGDVICRGTFELLVVDVKPQRTYKVELTVCSYTSPHDIARVLRDLRLKEHYVHAFFHKPYQCSATAAEVNAEISLALVASAMLRRWSPRRSKSVSISE